VILDTLRQGYLTLNKICRSKLLKKNKQFQEIQSSANKTSSEHQIKEFEEEDYSDYTQVQFPKMNDHSKHNFAV